MCGYFLGNFRGKLGNFLFHHLATLAILNVTCVELSSVLNIGFVNEYTLNKNTFLLLSFQISRQQIYQVTNGVQREQNHRDRRNENTFTMISITPCYTWSV